MRIGMCAAWSKSIGMRTGMRTVQVHVGMHVRACMVHLSISFKLFCVTLHLPSIFLGRRGQFFLPLLPCFRTPLGTPIELRNIAQMSAHGSLRSFNVVIRNSAEYFSVPIISTLRRPLIHQGLMALFS